MNMGDKKNLHKNFDERIAEEFQASLQQDKIQRIWRNFRQSGNSNEGKIIKSNFRKVFNKFGDKNEALLQALFERFKLDKSQQNKSEKQEVDIQDLAISLAILARIPYESKLRFIFSLTDVDQDGCLSTEEISKMIIRIQKNFCKQNSYANIESASLLYELSLKKAERTYREVIHLLKNNSNQLRQEENNLITCDQFIEALKKSDEFYKDEKFLPRIYSLNQILKNIPTEMTIQINESNKIDFSQFRKEIYTILKSNETKQNNNQIRYPGKIQIIKDNKIVEVLPTIEKNIDKKIKNQKIIKSKTNQTKANTYEDKKQYNLEQKNPDQTLESYRNKLKKMVQTKQDPRLNIHFDSVHKK